MKRVDGPGRLPPGLRREWSKRVSKDDKTVQKRQETLFLPPWVCKGVYMHHPASLGVYSGVYALPCPWVCTVVYMPSLPPWVRVNVVNVLSLPPWVRVNVVKDASLPPWVRVNVVKVLNSASLGGYKCGKSPQPCLPGWVNVVKGLLSLPPWVG